MAKYKPDEFINNTLLEKVNAEIEKQLEYEQLEDIDTKVESRIGIFGWFMLTILLIIVGLKLILLVVSYFNLFN